jgi:cold shock CspA family protein
MTLFLGIIKIKVFNFIKPDDKTKYIFFYVNELRKINLETILRNTKISFEIREAKNNHIHTYNLKLL